jgi:FG-GAP-like repeat
MLTANSGTVSVILGNGDGTFQPRTDYSVVAVAFGVASADFNDNGKPDLAVVNDNCNTSPCPNGFVSVLEV